MKKKFFLILRLAVSLSAVFLLLWMIRSSIRNVLETVKTANPFLYLFCLLIQVIIVIIISWRLKMILSAQGTYISLKEATGLNLIGIFFNNFMPTSVGGDVMKAYYASKSTGQKMKGFTAVFVDRMVGLTTIIFISAVVLILWGRGIGNQLVVNAILAMVISSMIFIILLANKTLAGKLAFMLFPFKRFGLDGRIKRAYHAVNGYGQYRRQMAYAFLISLGAQAGCVTLIYFLAKALNTHIPFKIIAVVVPLSATVSMVPSINGLGVREGALVYFLQNVIGRDKAFALSLLFLGLLIINSLIGGLVFLVKEHFRIKEIRRDMAAGREEAVQIEVVTEGEA